MSTITSQLSFGHSTGAGSAISDRATKLINNIHSTFQRRNAIVRRVNQIAGHKFEEILLTEPTKCSHCNRMVWGLWGQQCRPCKLMAHRKCLQAIETVCVFDRQTNVEQSREESHKIGRKTFKSLTMCDHCGILIKGIIQQGVECSTCLRRVHHNCETLHFERRLCQPRGETPPAQSNSNTGAYLHQSRVSIEDFEIVRLLGTGSFSKVYLARFHNEEFAIKAVKKTNQVVGSDPESLFTEWRALNFGRTYPFLTVGHCCFQSRERLYFVMEHVIGQDLVYHITKERKFTESRAKFYAAEIVLALNYLHRQRFVYRDLKLDNVILDKTGHCKLLDFGMSKMLSAEQRMRTRTFCGTPSYMSPEILRGEEYDYSTDWWSLGVLLYEMLTGFSPFEAQTEEATYDAIKLDELDLPPGLSDRAKSILDGLLTKDPRSRLGCQLLEGCSEAIRDHPFFLFNVNGHELHQWEALECKQIEPPYAPSVFDLQPQTDFKRVELTPIGSNQLKDISQSEFEEFSFYSDSFQDLDG